MGNSTVIGLKNLVYSKLTKDDSTGIIYGAVIPIADAMDAKRTPKTNTDVVYSDDAPSELITVQGETTLELGIKYLPLDIQADLRGHTIAGGVMIKKGGDIPPYVAIGFKNKKANGHYVYVWLLKGKFEDPDIENQTIEAKANPKYPKLKGTFVRRTFDDALEKVTDEDSLTYNSSIGTNWFTAVEAGDSTLPIVSTTVPANNATGVSVNTTYVWTFSENLDPSTVNSNNFYLIKDSDGSSVPSTIAYNDSAKTVTLTPAAALSTASKYIAVADVDVTELSGNHLVRVNKIFTTA